MDQHSIRFQIIARLHAQRISKDDLIESCNLKKRTLYLILSGRQKVSLSLLKSLSEFFTARSQDKEVSIEDLLDPIPTQFLS
jgi:hypothetical protein